MAKKYKVIIEETLERIVEVEAESPDEAVNMVGEQYDNEEIVLDYSDHDGTEILPELPVTIVLTNVKDGTVILYHLESAPDDVEAWLSEMYTNFDSNCSYMVTNKAVLHEHIY